MDAFEGIVSDLEYPTFIVTARAGEERLGCLVGFTTQASIDPPRFVVCLSHNNRTCRVGRDSTMLGVHAVPTRRVRPRGTLRRRDLRRDGQVRPLRVARGPEGVPILDRCESWSPGGSWRAGTRAITTRSCSSR
jgi:flavin reductase (DIM6/NTAB) family NADH-FMN oxidoreductase RutF